MGGFMETADNTGGRSRFSILLAVAAIISFVLYILTCFRSFTWWDSSEYSLAALTLGVPHPPGSLLTVILGWLAVKLPLGIDKFFVLNLLAAAMAAVTIYLVGRLALKIYYQTRSDLSRRRYMPETGAFLGALTFGVAITTWYYAIRFTPYITTVLLTALIIAAMLAWQRRASSANSCLWLGLITLLFGLDFSVHRTNLLMLPGLLIWILIFNPKTYLSLKNWVSGVIGLAAGLSVQLLLIPISAAQPFINFNNPSSLTRFWNYITLKQYGGGWLINIIPRKAPFLNTQVADYIKIFSDNFANSNLAYLGLLPLIVGLIGLAILFKRNWKLGLGLFVLFIFASLGAIIYFNLPADYFRSIDRHYMPSFVIFSIFVAYGAVVLTRFALRGKAVYGISVIIVAFLILMPVQAIRENYLKVDGSKSHFAYDTARNYLVNLPENTIFFSQADIDTYPLWCLQAAERLRPDITVCNLSLINTPWFIKQVQDKDNKFPIKLSDKELDSLSIIPWEDTTISISVNPVEINPADTCNIPDSIKLNIAPTIQGKYLLAQDQIILKIVQANNWRRPLCFSSLIPESSVQWLQPFLRLDGLYKRLMTSRSETSDIAPLRANLLENYTYRGFADPSIPKEEPTKWIAWNYCSSFLTLSSMEYSSGDTAGCKNTMAQMRKLLAPDDLSLPPELKNALANACR
jgi:uncharacterized membrane protein YagU involved in acid resistance